MSFFVDIYLVSNVVIILRISSGVVDCRRMYENIPQTLQFQKVKEIFKIKLKPICSFCLNEKKKLTHG